MTLRNLLLIALGVVCFTAAHAHQPYIEPAEGDAYLVKWGHGGETTPYDPANVQNLQAYGLNGKSLAIERSSNGPTVRIRTADEQSPIGMLALQFELGNTIKTAEGKFVHGSKQDYPNYQRAFYSVMYAKSLFGWAPSFAEPIGQELEIVPLANPYALNDGQALPVRLLHEGQPLAGALLTYTIGHDTHGSVVTDGHGRAMVPVEAGVPFAIYARHSIPKPDNPDVDERALTANLHVYPQSVE